MCAFVYRFYSLLLLFLTIITSSSKGEDVITGLCVRILDGDTVDVIVQNSRDMVRVRLWGIDAPEKTQQYGEVATRALAEMVLGDKVDILVKDVDRYGRYVGELTCAGVNINLKLLKNGYAWYYKKYASQQISYECAELSAQKERRGIWSDKSPVPPWEYREKRKGNYAVSPLIAAASMGHSDVVEYLILKGADINGIDGKLALLAAIEKGHAEVVRVLLDNGVDINTEKSHYTHDCYPITEGERESPDVSGHCIRVVDGDSVDILTASSEIKRVHLWGIDAPELMQSYGKESQQALVDKVYDKDIRIQIKGVDKNKHYVGEIFLNDECVNECMTAQGYAYINKQHLIENQHKLQQAESKAKESRKGVWQLANHEHPQRFRDSAKTMNSFAASALYAAAEENQSEIIKLLMEYGVEVKSGIGSKALYCAKKNGSKDVENLLKELGVNESRKIQPQRIKLSLDNVRESKREIGKKDLTSYSILKNAGENESELYDFNNGKSDFQTIGHFEKNIQSDKQDNQLQLIKAAAEGKLDEVKLLVEQKNCDVTSIYSRYRIKNNVEVLQKENNDKLTDGGKEISEKAGSLSTLRNDAVVNALSSNDNRNDVQAFGNAKESRNYSALIFNRDYSKNNITRGYEKIFIIAIACFVVLILCMVIINLDWFEIALKYNSYVLTSLLLSLGRDINYISNRKTALINAVIFNRKTLAKYLLNKGANPNLHTEYNVDCVLEIACSYGNFYMVNLLVENGASINVSNSKSITPLASACIHHHFEIAKYLISQGADVYSSVGNGKKTIFEYLYEKGDVEAVSFLLSLPRFSVQNNAFYLFKSLETSDVKMLMALLHYGFNVYTCNKNGESLLHVACSKQDACNVDLLLKRGLNLNAKNNEGISCLDALFGIHKIEKRRSVINFDYEFEVNSSKRHANHDRLNEILFILVKHGVTGNEWLSNGFTVLGELIRLGNLMGVQILIRNCSNVNKRDECSRTPLIVAAKYNRLEIFQLLIEKDCDINAKDIDGRTALFYACTSGDNSIVNLAISHGADVNIADKKGITPLIQASILKNIHIAQILLESNIRVDMCDDTGMSALSYSCLTGSIEIAALCIKYGANVNLPKFRRGSLLSECILRKRINQAALLIDNDADINSASSFGLTPLMQACRMGDILTVKKLLQKGVNLEVRNRIGDTTLIYACRHYSKCGIEIINLLLKFKCRVNEINMYNESALHIAIERFHVELSRLLIESNARIKTSLSRKIFSGLVSNYYKYSYSSSIVLEMIEILFKAGADPRLFDAEDIYNLSKRTNIGICDVLSVFISYGLNINLKYNETTTYFEAFYYWGLKSCSKERNKLTKLLLHAGANPNMIFSDNHTPLSCAITMADIDLVKLLVDNNANVNYRNIYGDNCLQIAIRANRFHIALFLIDVGVDVSSKNQLGETCLQTIITKISFQKEALQVLEKMIHKGINLDDTSSFSLSPPLVMLIKMGHIKLAEKLILLGANVNLRDENGCSCLELAIKNKYTSLALLLIENGANVHDRRPGCTTLLYFAERKRMISVVEKIKEKGGKRFVKEYKDLEYSHMPLLFPLPSNQVDPPQK